MAEQTYVFNTSQFIGLTNSTFEPSRLYNEVTSGALPATAPALAALAAGTGGVPAFWLDSNNS